MREIEKIFRAIRCAEEDKVTLATYMLQKRPAATFQRQDKKKTVYQTPQRSVAVGSSQVPSVRSPVVKKECPHCGKTHGGSECWLVAGRFLKGGSSDHKIKDFPRLQQGVQRGAPAPAVAAAALATGRPGRPRAPARVFALAREDAEQAEHVTEGTVLLLGVHARVLFDMGATHSFISERFARQLALESGVESEDLEVPLSVHTPAGTVSTRKCILSLPVCIEDRILDGCFFMLKMKDYDAILGLDWLEEHYALVIGVDPIAVYVVSASTLWTPTLIPASNDMDANFSDLHALQSQKFRRQGNSPIGELSPNGVVGDVAPLEETVETDSECGD
ncbi:hypothetical protein Taro_053240 [Colocasia esculenta]|uniref:Gag-pol polyprotein n=1 Tax=Colocasia esculenta TaxID=4460 RepID=A0A843XKM9_COLES|nr:hypothetical protein [Colocasia esculenta]